MEIIMRIEHDFHIHTNLSLCAKEDATVEYYVELAKKLGFKKIGFSDHFWDSAIEGANNFYRQQDYEHVALIKKELEKRQEKDLTVYFGCETEYDPVHHGVAITEETAEKFDYILVPNSHTHMMMPKECYQPYQKHVDFMVQAFEEILDCNVSRYVTAIAHPFEAVCCPYNKYILIDMISDDCFKRLFDKAAAKDIAFEINVSSMRQLTDEQIVECSPMRMFKLAAQCGCKFIFGSDSHDVGAHRTYMHHVNLIADILKLQEEDIVKIAR